MYNKIVGVFICILLFSVAVFPVMGTLNNFDRKSFSMNQGNLADNVLIKCRGTFPEEIIAIIWEIIDPNPNIEKPSYLTFIFGNYNRVDITLIMELEVMGRNNKKLFEYNITKKISYRPGENWIWVSLIYRDDLVNSNYLTGFFKAVLKLYVDEDGSQKTLVCRGFFFNFGSIIFKYL